jgi:hypothetical protein
MTWADKTDARDPDVWPDAVGIGDAALDLFLSAAYDSVKAYAPPLPDGATVPQAYVLANVLQARELKNASARGEQDVIGVGDSAIRARPLTAAVKQLLRPQSLSWTVG